MTVHARRAIAGACLCAVALAACSTPATTPAATPKSSSSTAPVCPAAGASPHLPAASEAASVTAVSQAAQRALSEPAGTHTTVTESLSAVTVLDGPCGAMAGTGAFDTATGDGALALTPRKATATSVSPDGYTVVYTATGIYIRMPASQTRSLPAGRPWVGAPFQVVNTPAYIQNLTVRRLFLQMLSANPRLIVTEIATGTREAARAGTVTVNGAPATEYQVVIDLEPAFALLKGTFTYRGPFMTFLSLPTPVDVAVDPSGALVQVTFAAAAASLGVVTMTFASPGSTPGASSPAPPAANVPAVTETVELSALLKIAESKSAESGESGGEGAGS